jgi:short-subunit dehydrogenase
VIVSNADTDDGAEFARTLCAAGATAVLTGSKFSALGSLAAELHNDTGACVAIFAGDLSCAAERREFAAIVSELFPS